MKTILITLAIVFSGMLFMASCGKDNGEYYVKYVASSSSLYFGEVDVTINTEHNVDTTFTINTSSYSAITIGPVPKGFNARLKIAAPNIYMIDLYTRIQVSKNGSPFALKASDGSDTNRKVVQISYTIDY